MQTLFDPIKMYLNRKQVETIWFVQTIPVDEE